MAIAAYGRIDPIGVYLLTSDDLINWSEPQLIIEAGWGWTQDGRLPYDAYPTLINHSSESLSFDTTGKFPHLYIVRINSLDPIRDYDLVRFPARALSLELAAGWHRWVEVLLRQALREQSQQVR